MALPFAGIGKGLASLANFFPAKGPQETFTRDTSGSQEEDLWSFLQSVLNTNNLINTSGQQNISGATTGTSDVTQTMSPQGQAFLNQLISQYSQQTKPVDISGIRTQGIRDINTSGDMQRQAVDNIMASRGLSTSPVAASTAAMGEQQRLGDINRFTSSLPMLQNQLNMGNLAAASNFLTAIPKGTSTATTGSNVGQQSTVGQQSQAGQQTSNQTQQGTRDQTTKGYEHTLGQTKRGWGGPGDLIGGLGGMLAGIFGG